MDSPARNDDPAFTEAFGDRGGAGQTSQCMIISALQGVVCFCEQRGEDDPSDARQGRRIVLRGGRGRSSLTGGAPVRRSRAL